MQDTCPVMSPEDARRAKVVFETQSVMLDEIAAAITEAYEAAARKIGSKDAERPVPPRDYFMAVAHHDLFLRLCKADPETSKGGRPDVAASILRNFQGLARSWVSQPAD